MLKARPHRVFCCRLLVCLTIALIPLIDANSSMAGPNPHFVAIDAVSQPALATPQYRSAASGNWNSIASWEVSTDAGLNWVAASVTPLVADDTITIRSGHTITISASGLSYDQVTVDAGGQVTVAAGVTSTLANGAGTDLVINGTWLNSGGTWTTTGTWAVNAGGTYIHNTSSGISTPLNQVTLDPASSFIYRGNSATQPAISMSGRTYGNLSFDCSSGSYAVTPSGAGTLTVNGDFTIASCVTYSTLQTGAMTFVGNFTNNGTLTNSTGTQVYTFAGSGKTIGGASPSSFETFNIGAAASVTAASPVTLLSGFTGTISGSFAAAAAITNSGTMNVNGTFRLDQGGAVTGNPLVYGAGSTLGYAGTSPQTTGNIEFPVASGPVNLTVNNTSGVTLHASRTVTGLNLTAGALATGGNILTIASGGTISRTTGVVTGILQRTVASTGTYVFDVGTPGAYSPVSLNVTAGTFPSTMRVETVAETLPGLAPARSVSRHWRLTEGGDITADLSFTYLAGDVNGNEADYRVWRRSGGVDQNMCPVTPCVNTLTHTVGIAGVSTFSAWSAAEALIPTAAAVSLGGRVMTADGRGIRDARLTIAGGSLNAPQVFVTGSLGYYNIDGLVAGESYIVTVSSNRFTFTAPVRVFTVVDSVGDANFVADP